MKNIMINKFWYNFILILMFIIYLNINFINHAIAQEGKTQKVHELESITVTAQKQEENVRDVPVAISVFNEQNIEDMQIESILDLANFVPNLMIFDNGQPGANSPSMRGVHGPDGTVIVSTALYVDGIPVMGTMGFETEMYDVERIEVLRGPQGTLYGKNAETGVINIITRQPDNNFRGRIAIEAGEDNKRQTTASFSTPLVEDKLYFSLSGRFYEKDGFITHTETGKSMDDRQRWASRGQLRWTPTDNLDISLIASRFQYDDDQMNINLTDGGYEIYGFTAPGYRMVSSNMEGKNDSRITSEALKASYDINSNITLTSVTTHRMVESIHNMDWDFTPYTLTHNKTDTSWTKISQELRLDSSAENFKWLIGLYYDDDHTDDRMEATSDYPSMAYGYDRDIYENSFAAFGHFTYTLTSKLYLLGGLRYERQDSEFEDHLVDTRVDETWNAITPKFALEYRFTPSVMAYVTVAQGYRSGGFNIYSNNPDYYSFDSESLWSHELGFKSMLLSNSIILNGAAYYMDIEDMQVTEAINPAESWTTNAAKATSYGGELELTAKVTDGLTIMAGLGISNIEFESFVDAMGDYEGNNVPYAPEYTYSIGAQYRYESGFYVRVDLSGYGDMFLDKNNYYSREAYQVFNTKIGYETENFDVYLYAKNLFDEVYDSVGYYSGFYTIYSEPREVGMQLVYRF